MANATVAERFAQSLNKKFSGGAEAYVVKPGQKYDKVVTKGHYGGSVHAFVVKATGDLVKAASWAAPAKKANGELAVRFNLSTPEGFAAAVDAADPFGGYLYAH